MSKALAMTGLVVSVILLLTFGLDLALGLPFGQPSMTLDVAFVICSALLAFMSLTTWRELR